MKYTITTYANNGDEIVSRNYNSTFDNEDYSKQVESIIEDSITYLEEQALDYGEERKDEFEMPGFEGTLEELDNLKIK
jgi:hypothetical protein